MSVILSAKFVVLFSFWGLCHR